MTELIVALDNDSPYSLMMHLQHDIEWFKLGPQAICNADWHSMLRSSILNGPKKIFLDLKLNDTDYTVSESIRRYSDFGIAAVSVSTGRYVDIACNTIEKINSELKVWNYIAPSDQYITEIWFKTTIYATKAHGIICPAQMLQWTKENFKRDIIAVGVRNDTLIGDHFRAASFDMVKQYATYAVVGRPIIKHTNPLRKAREIKVFLE